MTGENQWGSLKVSTVKTKAKVHFANANVAFLINLLMVDASF